MSVSSLSCKDLANVLYDFYLVKLQAPKLYDLVIKYFN